MSQLRYESPGEPFSPSTIRQVPNKSRDPLTFRHYSPLLNWLNASPRALQPLCHHLNGLKVFQWRDLNFLFNPKSPVPGMPDTEEIFSIIVVEWMILDNDLDSGFWGLEGVSVVTLFSSFPQVLCRIPEQQWSCLCLNFCRGRGAHHLQVGAAIFLLYTVPHHMPCDITSPILGITPSRT